LLSTHYAKTERPIQQAALRLERSQLNPGHLQFKSRLGVGQRYWNVLWHCSPASDNFSSIHDIC